MTDMDQPGTSLPLIEAALWVAKDQLDSAKWLLRPPAPFLSLTLLRSTLTTRILVSWMSLLPFPLTLDRPVYPTLRHRFAVRDPGRCHRVTTLLLTFCAVDTCSSMSAEVSAPFLFVISSCWLARLMAGCHARGGSYQPTLHRHRRHCWYHRSCQWTGLSFVLRLTLCVLFILPVRCSWSSLRMVA
ncbi:hypothetical protein TPAR_06494, partial [Tolypocladium paradoxum]